MIESRKYNKDLTAPKTMTVPSQELKRTIQLELDTLRSMEIQGGPEPSDFPVLAAVLEHLSDNISDEDEGVYADYIPTILEVALSERTLMGMAFKRPHGYSGNYELLEKTYQHFVSDEESVRKWDAYWNQTALSKALCNRKEYFKTLLYKTERFNPRARILSLGSGPAIAISEYLAGQPHSNLSFVLVDPDEMAQEVARSGCVDHLSQIEIVTKGLFEFEPSQQYDLIWSAHSFDYFDQENYSGLLADMLHHLSSGGQVVIGNFSHSDTNTAFMRFIGWHVYHRSHIELKRLAVAAGARDKDIHVHNRADDVNLFLHVGRDIRKLF